MQANDDIWIAPPSLQAYEAATAQHRKGDSPWPFLYSYREGTVVINKAKKPTKYQEAQDLGEALL